MKHPVLFLVTCLFLIPCQTPAQKRIDMSGFGDFLFTTQQNAKYRIGQAEIDLETSLEDRIVVNVAIAFTGHNFVLGAFTADFGLWGDKSNHFWQSNLIESSGLLVGKFDVPFGIDYMTYPSISRKLISVPLIVANTHGCWNDTGLQFYIQNKWANAVFYATNGLDINNNMSLGSRLGLRPALTLELGASYAVFLNKQNQRDMEMVGADVQIELGPLSFKGEYIIKKEGFKNLPRITRKGFYGQGLITINRLFFINRYDYVKNDGAISQRGLSTGMGWIIRENAECRSEYQYNFDAPDVSYMQIVVGF